MLADDVLLGAPDLAVLGQVLRRVREGTYEGKAGQQVYFQDSQTVQDAIDLFNVLDELDHQTGSPNLENELARQFVNALQAGQWLSDFQLGKLREMLATYRTDITDLRSSPTYRQQDPNNTPPPERARIDHFNEEERPS